MKKLVTKILSNIILTFSITLILSIIITCVGMSMLIDVLGFKDNIFLLYIVFINTLTILNMVIIALFLAIKYIKIIMKVLNGDYNKNEK